MSKNLNLSRTLPYIYLIAAIIGGLAAFALTYDKIQVLKNPAYIPSCNINPILSCGDIMKTKQADLLGIPNPIYGLIGFSMLLTFGLVIKSEATFKRWLWQVVNLGALAGWLFSVYLFFEGVFRIHAICPYCFVIWMITPPVIWYTTVYNLREGNIKLPFKSNKVRDWILRHHGDILFSWYALVFITLLVKFWYYWKTLI